MYVYVSYKRIILHALLMLLFTLCLLIPTSSRHVTELIWIPCINLIFHPNNLKLDRDSIMTFSQVSSLSYLFLTIFH